MTIFTHRRDFLRTTVAAAGAVALGAAPSRAIEPVRRLYGPRFKYSLAAYSYRELFKAKTNPLSIEEFIADCAKFELDGTELTSYYLPQDGPAEKYRELKANAFRLGLDVSGTAIGNDLCFPPGTERDKQIAHVKKWIEYADQMDAPVIRIFSGDKKKGQTLADAQRLAIEGIEECCKHAGKYGVFLALENHGGITTDVASMLAVVRGVKSEWFGVNVDTGNFHSNDVYGDLEKIAPYALNVQVKVSVKPADGPRKQGDFKRLAAIMRAAGYRGYIVLEYEEKGDPRTECRKYLDEIRTAFA